MDYVGNCGNLLERPLQPSCGEMREFGTMYMPWGWYVEFIFCVPDEFCSLISNTCLENHSCIHE
jgi:hypothetical protein